MTASPHVPARLCVGCGTRAPQPTLLRFAARADGGLVLVATRPHSGRSGYLHRQSGCWERFAARSGRLRSLGRTVDKPRRLAFVQELKAADQSAMVR